MMEDSLRTRSMRMVEILVIFIDWCSGIFDEDVVSSDVEERILKIVGSTSGNGVRPEMIDILRPNQCLIVCCSSGIPNWAVK